ncbi:MAG TPA: site-specific integrase [Solirubrobacteraceae bacterium]|nr:site-specific integrase [Solirubrobacteraceae bacterium]
MARPRRGTLKRRPTKQGTSYGVSFTYRGEEFYVHFGGEWEGWDEERAEEEQRFLMEKVNRGEWTPAPAQSASTSAQAIVPSFQVEASQWLHRRKLITGDLDGRSKTIRDLEWRLSVVMDKFGSEPIDRVDFALADELVVELCEERAAIERAAAEGVPLTRTMRDPRTGRRYEARRRAVSNGSIRKALDAAERVLRDARKRGALTGEVPALKSAAPKSDRPRRSFLEAEQVVAVIRAADLIEAEHRGLTWETVALIRASNRSAVSLARELRVSDTLIRKVRRGELWSGGPEPRNRNDVPRRVIIETLILGGLRVSELCGLDGPHLDLPGGRLRVPRSATKSDAGERVVPIVPALQSRLTAHRQQYPTGHGQPAFPTRNGTRQQPDNIRSRILGPIRGRANEQLESEGRPRIGHMTPHTLRRTFASILAVCDVPPRRAMYLMGHTDPTLTLAVYQQVLDMGKGSVGLLEQTLGCTLPEARTIYNGEATAGEVLGAKLGTAAGRVSPGRSKGRAPKNGRARRRVSGTNPEPGDQNASSGREEPAIRHKKTPPERGFLRSG